VIENFFVSGIDEPLRVTRHVNPDGSLGGYVCIGAEISPNETIERDEIVLSEKEYVNANLFAHIHTMCHSMVFRNINIMSYYSSYWNDNDGDVI